MRIDFKRNSHLDADRFKLLTIVSNVCVLLLIWSDRIKIKCIWPSYIIINRNNMTLNTELTFNFIVVSFACLVLIPFFSEFRMLILFYFFLVILCFILISYQADTSRHTFRRVKHDRMICERTIECFREGNKGSDLCISHLYWCAKKEANKCQQLQTQEEKKLLKL